MRGPFELETRVIEANAECDLLRAIVRTVRFDCDVMAKSDFYWLA